MNGIIIFIGLLFILSVGRTLFIPLAIATFVWYLLNAIAAYYRKVLPLQKTKPLKTKTGSFIFDILSKLLSFATFGGLVYMFMTHIRPAFSALVMRLPEITERLVTLQSHILYQWGINLNSNMLPDADAVLSSVGASATQFSTALGLVLVYILFMYIEQSTFSKKFRALFPEKKRFNKMDFILKSIDDNMKKYMFVKTLASAMTAVLSYFWLSYLGVEFASVWAFIIFIMNYIPTFGTIIATTLPILYSLLVAPSAELPLMIAAGLIGLQILIGNILEPRLTGKTLNLSTLAILINLVFWGMLWGPAGMFFSVPLLVATFVITAQFDSTRWVAVLLSANGEIPDKEED